MGSDFEIFGAAMVVTLAAGLLPVLKELSPRRMNVGVMARALFGTSASVLGMFVFF